MIRHTVSFNLVHLPGSEAEETFLQAARALGSIPGVRNLELWSQRDRVTGFSFELAMEFVDDVAYETYNAHPDHVQFVIRKWKPEVFTYKERDFVEQDGLLSERRNTP